MITIYKFTEELKICDINQYTNEVYLKDTSAYWGMGCVFYNDETNYIINYSWCF